MNLPEYIAKEEVKRVCEELGICDWSEKKELSVSTEEAGVVLEALNVQGMDIPLDVFRTGLQVELEHGTMYAAANVTNNHPILTGKIVLAHLYETMDYYTRLDVAEIEGDMLKAAAAGNAEKLLAKYRRLIQAKLELAGDEAEELGS